MYGMGIVQWNLHRIYKRNFPDIHKSVFQIYIQGIPGIFIIQHHVFNLCGAVQFISLHDNVFHGKNIHDNENARCDKQNQYQQDV